MPNDVVPQPPPDMATAVARHDWAATPVGPAGRWPQPLQTLVATMLGSRQPMFVTWGPARTLLYNDSYASLLGPKHPSALGRAFLDVWSEVRADLEPLFAEIEAGRSVHRDDIELHLDRGAGPREAHFAFSYTPVRDDRGSIAGLFCACTETTDRVFAERELVAFNERARQMFDQAPGFICVLRGPNHVFEIVNRAYSRLIGDRPALGRAIVDVLPEAVERGSVALLDRVWATGEAVVRRYSPFSLAAAAGEQPRTQYLDFVYQPITDTTGRVTGIFVQGNDVTEAYHADLERRERDAWIQSLSKTIPGFLWGAGPDGGLTQTSGPWVDYSGHGATETLGDGWVDFVHPDDVARTTATWAACVADGVAYSTEFRVRRADGAYRWNLVRASPMRDGVGAITGWVGLNVDIDDQKRAEAALQSLNETLEQRIDLAVAERERVEDALRQTQKMEAIGQLTGGIAHDFNNMLQGVIGSLELIRRRVEQGRSAEVPTLLDRAGQAADRAATLTRRLLGFARRQMLVDRAVDPNTLVSGMAELVRHTVGPDVAFNVELSSGSWTVRCDANQLESAILNLVLNARDAMPNGGSLSLSTAELTIPADETGVDGVLLAGDYAEIAVGDTGCGMTADNAARAFEPFFTTKPIGQGTGLGLSQLYGFARQSGGTVRLQTAPGRGTTARLLLPRDQSASAAESRPPTTALASLTSGTILLVEDEPAIRALACEALAEIGCTVIEAADGRAALAILAGGERIDALVSDVGLPGGMNGRQLADAARERRPGLPVLFITGYAGHALPDGRLDPGMSVIGKPFTLDTLTRAVTSMLAGVGQVVA